MVRNAKKLIKTVGNAGNYHSGSRRQGKPLSGLLKRRCYRR